MNIRFLFSLLFLASSTTAFAGYDDYNAKHDKKVSLPSCSGSDVKVIKSNSDWSDINSSKFRVFCVKPGDYSGKGKISISQNGTSDKPRVIRLYSDQSSNKKPWTLGGSSQAKVKALRFEGAAHWIVDGITVTDPKYTLGEQLIGVVDGSKNLIINNVLLEKNNDVLVRVTDGAKDITVQNSVLRETRVTNSKTYACIYVAARDSFGSTVNPHFVNNEIYDCSSDGIQVNSQTKDNPSYGIDGLVVENNDIYVTKNRYTDGKGRYSTSGKYACAENALDIKVNAVRSGEAKAQILHNRMWGFRASEPNTGLCNSNGSPIAPAVTMHWPSAKSVLLKDNIIFNSENGVWISKDGPKKISINGNLFYDVANKTNDRAAISLDNGDYVEAYYNTVVKSGTYMRGGANHVDVRNNVFVDGGQWGDQSFNGSDSIVAYNFFYNSEKYSGKADGGKNVKYGSASDAKNGEFCFKTKRQTGGSKVCVPNVIASSNSPHVNEYDSKAGSRSGYGVDNNVVSGKMAWGGASSGGSGGGTGGSELVMAPVSLKLTKN